MTIKIIKGSIIHINEFNTQYVHTLINNKLIKYKIKKRYIQLSAFGLKESNDNEYWTLCKEIENEE